MATKEEHRTDVVARLQEVEAEMDKLKASASQMETAAQKRFNELMKNLHTSKAVVEGELMELVESEAWARLKEKMNTTLKDLHRAVKDVAAQCR
jgi:hypothetical protein